MMKILTLAAALSPCAAFAQEPRLYPPCQFAPTANGGSVCAPGQGSPGGGLGSNVGNGAGGIGSGGGSGGVGTFQTAPEFNALPRETQDGLTVSRDAPATLRFDNPKQLRDFKSLSVGR